MTTVGATRQDPPIYAGEVYRDDGSWLVELPDAQVTLRVERLGYQCQLAIAEAKAALGEHPDRARVIVTAALTYPRLPPYAMVHSREPVNQLMGKNASWFLAYPGAFERVSWGDYSPVELIRVYETMPEDVLAVATAELRDFDGWDEPLPELLARKAQLCVDHAGIYIVKSRETGEVEMAATVRGTPQLWLPIVTPGELAERISTVVGR